MINLVVVVILLMPTSLAANTVVNLVGTLVVIVALVITATITENASIVTLTWSDETMIEPATVIGTIIPTIIVKSTTLTVAGYVLCRFYYCQFDAHNKKGANRNDRRRCYICNTPGHIAIRHNAWALTHQRHVAGSIGMTVREPQTR
jgi:hypothetical protein